jgi:hypothetical protein
MIELSIDSMIYSGDIADAIRAGVNHALACGRATIVSREGFELITVVPDVILAEVYANGWVLPGGVPVARPHGRAVLVLSR